MLESIHKGPGEQQKKQKLKCDITRAEITIPLYCLKHRKREIPPIINHFFAEWQMYKIEQPVIRTQEEKPTLLHSPWERGSAGLDKYLTTKEREYEQKHEVAVQVWFHYYASGVWNTNPGTCLNGETVGDYAFARIFDDDRQLDIRE